MLTPFCNHVLPAPGDELVAHVIRGTL